MQNLKDGNFLNIKTSHKEDIKGVTKPKTIGSINPMSKIVGITPKINLNNIKVIKKDGTKEDYNIEKVVSAIKKSAARMLVELKDKDISDICNFVNKSVMDTKQQEIEIFKMHCIVENTLVNFYPKFPFHHSPPQIVL